MSYSPSGNITNKNIYAQTEIAGNVVGLSYDNTYDYNYKPHAVSSISNVDYEWDGNGNLTRRTDNYTWAQRFLCWDEENRLNTLRITGGEVTPNLSSYIYNASGERTWKLTGYEQQMWINGQTVVNIVNFAKTLYASPYMVMNEKEYTKHYYAGSERVCTKIGSGFSLAPTAPVGTQQVEAINEQTPEEISNGLWTMVARGIECAEFNPAYVMIDKKLEPAYNMGEEPENDRYFYHPDHLGSSSFVTDVAGHAIQHLQYLPFGELFADQRHDSPYHTPYKFSAKEKDEESGYSYFGARYYDSDLSVWLSVDPMADKYPSLSPYNYCANNPVMLTDPDGTHIDPTELLKSVSHARAAILFAKTKEGKLFLDKYASKGQKFTYQGDIIYEAKEAGEYDKKGINLIYRVGGYVEKSTTSSSNSADKNYKFNIYVDIAIDGYGSNNKFFNLVKAIVHESFLHVDSHANDLLDDGLINYSNLPKYYQQYKNQGDHYFIGWNTLNNEKNEDNQLFPVSGFNLLKQVSHDLKLGLSDIQIKTIMWDFSGSIIEVDKKNGKLIFNP